MPKSKTRKKPQKKSTTKKLVTSQQGKIKVLGYCDSPTAATGFGTVSRNVFEGLYNTGRYDVDILGINYWGDPYSLPYRLWPTGTNSQKDPYGRQKVLNMIPQMDFDILFLLQDSFILEFVPKLIEHLRKTRAKPFRSILYYPVDSIIKQPWAENVNPADYLIAYSEFGKKETLKRIDRPDLGVIPHGVNTAEYYPLPKEEVDKFKKQYFGPFADHFIITNVNRNQQRKDIPRTIMAFKEFRKQVPNSILYLHMAMKDQGWDLAEVCKSFEMDITKDIIFPKNFGPNQGYPRHVLNLLYNCSDVVVSTTLGEGFGLCLHPNTCIYTRNGIKEIKDITIVDEVLSSDGSYNDVESIMSRPYKGALYEITTWLSNIPIKSSPDHGLKVLEGNKYVWKKAAHLKEEDILLFPKNHIYSDTKKINILNLITPSLNSIQIGNIINKNGKFTIQSNFTKESVFVPEEIDITKNLMRLFGLYLAEGCVNTSKMDSIIFSFHKDEQYLLDFVETEMKNIFGLEKYDVNTDSRGEDYNGKSIKFYSSPIAYLFHTLFGAGARNKKIHPILLDQSKELLKEFVHGEFLGDGSIAREQLTFSTTSRDIAYGVRLILAKLGILSSVRTSRVEYKISITGISKENYLKMFDMPYPDLDRKRANERCDQNADYLLLPIRKIEKSFYKGKLVDIQVANTNDFVAENVVVHNSWLEAMGTKTPIIMPANTMLPEFITEETGWLCDSGSDPSHWTVIQFDNEVPRPLVDVNSLVETLVEIHNNPEEAKRRAENAYKWVNTKMDWQRNIAPMWVKLFDRAWTDMQEAEKKREEGIDDIIGSLGKKKAIETEEF